MGKNNLGSVWNFIPDLKALKKKSTIIFLSTLLWLDAQKRIEKIIPNRHLNKELKKHWLKCNLRLALISHGTTGPWYAQNYLFMYAHFSVLICCGENLFMETKTEVTRLLGLWRGTVSIGNYIISHAVWNKSAGVNFSIQTAQALRANAIFSLWKVHECWYIPNCLRKIMWLLVNDIQANVTLTESSHQSQNLHLGSPQRWLSLKRIGKFRYSLTQRN